MRLPKRAAELRPDSGQKIMILCPGYWGKGDTPSEAVRKLPFSLDKSWVLYTVDPSTTIDDDGMWTRKTGTPAPREISRAA